MDKQEYKKLSHSIRLSAWKNAKYRSEKSGKKCSTRNELHNLFCWCDDLIVDKFGKWHYTYCCIGDYDVGLVWGKS